MGGQSTEMVSRVPGMNMAHSLPKITIPTHPQQHLLAPFYMLSFLPSTHHYPTYPTFFF